MERNTELQKLIGVLNKHPTNRQSNQFIGLLHGSGGAGKQTEEAGSGGGDGAALRRTSGFAVTINNSGTIQGSTTATNVD